MAKFIQYCEEIEQQLMEGFLDDPEDDRKSEKESMELAVQAAVGRAKRKANSSSFKAEYLDMARDCSRYVNSVKGPRKTRKKDEFGGQNINIGREEEKSIGNKIDLVNQAERKPEDNPLHYATVLGSKYPSIYASIFPWFMVEAFSISAKYNHSTASSHYSSDTEFNDFKEEVQNHITKTRTTAYKTKVIQQGIISRLQCPQEIIAHMVIATFKFSEKVQGGTIDYATTEKMKERKAVEAEKKGVMEVDEVTAADVEAEQAFSNLIDA